MSRGLRRKKAVGKWRETRQREEGARIRTAQRADRRKLGIRGKAGLPAFSARRRGRKKAHTLPSRRKRTGGKRRRQAQKIT